MQKMKRSHYCGELRLADAGQAAKLTGWVMRRRDHGGVISSISEINRESRKSCLIR